MLKRIVDFEVIPPPPPRDGRTAVALVVSAILHAAIVLLLIFGIPVSTVSSRIPVPATESSEPIALAPPPTRATSLPKLVRTPKTEPQPQTPPPQPPPPTQEVALGPDSKKPDEPAKEAAAKQSDPDAAAGKAKVPDPTPTPPPEEVKPPEAQPPAPQRLQVPRPGDYTGAGAIPMPTTSPWGPPKIDSASGAPPVAMNSMSTGTMGRSGLSSHDPGKWENSFDDETAGRCVQIPDLGKNPDGSPVLAAVIGRVLDTDGRSPLAGAHLQIMGTQFGTFSDGNGEYRLAFDPHMLAQCRKQYVKVDAPGYAGETLTLMIGPRVRSDDVVMRRH